MWLLPIDCAGLTRAIPPGQYLLPWHASHDEIDALCRLLRTVLDGIRCEIRLDDAGLIAAARRGTKARDALVVACIEDKSASFEQASCALRGLGARYALLQFPMPQETGYGWLEQEIKVPLLEAIGRMITNADHPLSPFNIRVLPVLEAAALTTDPIELIELLERTIAHRLKYEEIGVEAPDYLRSLLLVSGQRLAERLLRLSRGDCQIALEVLVHQGKGPTDNLRFRAGAAALEQAGLARYVSGDLSLGPMARRALDAAIVGSLESTLPDYVWTEEARVQIRAVRTTNVAPIVEPIVASMAGSGAGRAFNVPIPVNLLDEPTQRIFAGQSEATQALDVLRQVAVSAGFSGDFPEGLGESITTTLRWCEEISEQSTNVAAQRVAKVIESLLRFCAARGANLLARQREAIRSLEEAVDALAEDWCEAVLLGALFWHSTALIFRRQSANDFERGRALVYRCLESWQKMPGAERSVAAAYVRLSKVARIVRDFERAREWNEKAIDLGKKINDNGIVADATLELGYVAGSLGWHKYAAEGHVRDAMHLYEQIGDIEGIASACLVLAWIEAARGNFAAGRSFVDRARELDPQSEDSIGYITLLEFDGEFELLTGNSELAERHFKQVIRLSEALNAGESAARGYWWMSGALRRRGATDGAMVYLKRAVEIYEELGMRLEADQVRRASLAT